MNTMFCGKKAVMEQKEIALQRIPKLLEEFEVYFNTGRAVSIEVEPKFWGVDWSLTADLLFNGELVQHYDSFDLLELDLLNMELSVCGRQMKNYTKP